MIDIKIDITQQYIKTLSSFHTKLVNIFETYSPIPIIDDIIYDILKFAGMNKKPNIKPILLKPIKSFVSYINNYPQVFNNSILGFIDITKCMRLYS